MCYHKFQSQLEAGRTSFCILTLQTQLNIFRFLQGTWQGNKCQRQFIVTFKCSRYFLKENTYFLDFFFKLSLIMDSPQIMPKTSLWLQTCLKKYTGHFMRMLQAWERCTNIRRGMEVLKQQMWRNSSLRNWKCLVSNYSLIAFKIS